MRQWVKVEITRHSECKSRYSELNTRCSEGPQNPKDQLRNQAYSLSLFTVAKMRCLDLLEHKTLGYKRGHNNHFRGYQRENEWKSILERETPRELDFLEDSP